MTLTERYDILCKTPADIHEHLPVLRRYAEQCDSIAELGVQCGKSTTAFLMGQPELLVSIDVQRRAELDELSGAASEWHKFEDGSVLANIGKTSWDFRLEDSRTCILPAIDLLFIDSAHCYDQTKAELERHAGKVRKWLIFHDTVSYGEFGEAGPPQVGIGPAISEFLSAHPEWTEREHFSNNNGLLVLERTDG